jgi:hypothetical protein
MTRDQAIRIECVKAAVATVGNPNHVQTAREYYAFVTEPNAVEAFMEGAEEAASTHQSIEAAEAAADTETSEELSASQQLRPSRKGSRK